MRFPRRLKLSLLAVVVVLVVAPVAWRMFWYQRPPSIFTNFTPSLYGKTWTVTGSADSPLEAFVDTYGSFQPTKDRYSVRYLIYDNDRHKLYSPYVKEPESTKRELVEGYLPAPRVAWEEDGISVQSTTFVVGDPDVCYSTVALKNTSSRRTRNISLFVTAVPTGLFGRYSRDASISYDSAQRIVLSNGSVFVDCSDEPDAFGAVRNSHDRSHIRDITSYIVDAKLPRMQSAEPSHSDATSAALRYDLRLGPEDSKKLTFVAPMIDLPLSEWVKSDARKVGYSEALQVFKMQWAGELNRVKLDLPDKRYADCFRASLAYLMILSDDGAPQPGATMYELMWVRDFAYIADALYSAGRADLLPRGLEHLRALGRPDGGYAPQSGKAVDEEYDAPGQAIYALLQSYRRTGDLARLAADWPSIRKSCEYLRAERLKNERSDDERGGILPPSMSAEDLGKPNEQHYWDDFWAWRGLTDAAYAADQLGHDSDAAWIRAEAGALRDALWRSIRAVIDKHGIDYIPNGPDDVTSSAMARGTTCGLWPCGLLDTQDPLVRSSFDAYWAKWVAPYDGGFKHNGDEFWPYAGLDLAQCYLELGQYERVGDILRWSIEHDPTGGFYSWPEGMNMKDLSLANGDMPHGWMCASYILLLRNVLVRESGDDLMLASGVPDEWLAPGEEIRVRDFPTLHGKVSYRLSSKPDRLLLNIDGDASPRSYVLILPGGMSVEGVVVDGVKTSAMARDRVVVPGSTREVEIEVGR